MTIRVLYVDQGVTFGGSIVVAGLIANHLDSREFSSSVVIPFEDEFTNQVFRGSSRVHRRRRFLPYNRIRSHRDMIETRFPRGVRKIAHAGLSLLDVLARTVYCLRLAVLIVRDGVQVVHVNNSIEAVAAGLLTGRPVLAHLHGYFSAQVPLTHRWLYRRCSAIVAISDCVRRSAEAAGLADSGIRIVPNGTRFDSVSEEARVAVRARWGVPASAPLIALVGRVVAWKGHKEFLQAAALVHRRHPEVHFIFVGGVSDGNPEFLDELFKIAEENGLSGAVHCTGYVADVAAHIDAADMLVHASIDPEPFGLVVIEGMAMSKPVIASKLGAGPEIVTHEHDGLIVDPRDPGGLCEAMCRLLEDRELAASLALAARRTVEERFTAEAMARQFEQIYRGIAGKGLVAAGGGD